MKSKSFGLTAPQNSIWLTEQFYQGTNINNICGYITIFDKVDFDKLSQAINIFIENTDDFRIKLFMEDSIVKQYVSEFSHFDIEVIYVASDEDVSILANNVNNTTFNMIESLLFMFKLYKFPDGHGGFIINAHHIISDSWALGILINEIISIYSCLLKNEKIDFSNYYSYIDYINSEQEYIHSDKFLKDKEYWDNIYSSIPENATIPSVKIEASKNVSIKAERELINIEAETLDKINKFCTENKVSTYNFFMAVFSLYLSRVSNLDDFVIGTPIINRTNFKEKHTAGMFINTIPLRISINNDLKFKEFVSKIALDSLGMLRHQKYSYQYILENLRKQDSSLPNLYNIMLSYQVTKMTDNIETIPHNTKWTFNKNIADDIDIHLYDFNDNCGLNVAYDYKIDKYSKEDITALHARILHIINQVISNNDIDLKNIEIVTPEEKNQILFDFNNTSVPYPKDKTVVQLFEEQVEKNPNNVAVVFEDKKLSYKELNEKANQLAHYLRDNGIKNNDIIGIMVNRSLEMIVGILAILKSGAAYLPIDPDYPSERISYMLEDSGCQNILVNDFTYNYINNNSNKINIILSSSIYQNTNNENLNINISLDNLIYLIYTSGSTGKPKGVLLTHKNILNFVCGTKSIIEFSTDKVMVSLTTICFDIFVLELWCSLTSGMKLVIANEEEQNNAHFLRELCLKNNVTMIQTTPSRFTALISNQKNIDFFKFFTDIMIGGEPLSEQLLIKLKDYTDAKIFNMYGPTETAVWSTIKDLTNNNIITVGKPISNTTCYILDKNLHLLPPYVPGELYIGGEGVSNGYKNRLDLTNEKFINSPFREKEIIYNTNDLAYFKNDGEIVHLGRTDFQLKINGYRIDLSDIEKNIQDISNISNCIVLPIDISESKKILCAFLISNTKINVRQLKNNLLSVLPKYMIPSYFVQLESLPLTPNGKIDRKELFKIDIKQYREQKINDTISYNETTKKLVNLISKYFNITDFDINDNLFDIGMDSLSIIILSTHISSEFNVIISIKDMIECNSIIELATLIEKNTNSNILLIPRAEKKEYYPVSSAQKRMYYSSSVDGENSLLYNIAGGIILDKVLDSNKLEQCLQTIINRHESLRTYFEVIDGNIVQKIVEHINFKLKTENSNSTDIDSLFNDFVKPFNLNKAPLFNAKLITLANNKSLLLLNMHHIISDGTSMSILVDELCNLYNGSNNLPELDIDYKDFAVWENNNINSNEYKKSEEFWVNQFNDEIPLLNMPTNYPRPNVQNFEGNSIYTNINKSLTNKINKLAKELGLTPYMFLLSIYYILLYKYTGQEDIIVGSPITGRDNIQLSNIIGMFVNSLALRSKIDSTLSFTEFSNNIKSMCLQAFEHQTYPFDELVNKLEITRDTSRNPLFDTMFIYQNNGNANVHFDGINSKYYIPNSNISKFDLSLEIIPENDALNLRFEYCTKLFDKEFIEKLSKHYINILNTILENKEIKLANIDMLSEEEKNQILFDFNNTAMPYPKNKTVVQLFEEQVEKNPDNIAIVFEDKKLSYKELNENANQLAHCLILNNIEENDVVGIMLERSFETIISMFAVLKANASYMLIDPTLPKDRITYMLENANSPLLICSSELKNIDFDNKLYINTENLSIYDNINLHLKHNINNNLSVVYTSGSTGLPKGVLLKQQSMVNLIFSYKDFIDIQHFENFLSICSMSFDMFAVEIFIPILNGKTLVLASEEEHKNPIAISDLIGKYYIDFMMITPSKIQLLLSNTHTTECLIRLKSIQLGGEALTSNLYNNLRSITEAQICNEYGPSEITSCCSFKEITSSDNINIGKPINNVQIYILNKDNNLCPIGVEGEICISGNGVSKGYINNPTATNNSFIQNPFGEGLLYKTGDIGKFNSIGEIEYIGRKDFQIKLRGLRIELSEIEKQLSKIQYIRDCSVICKNAEDNNSYLVAFYTSTSKIETAYIRSELSKHLPLYMVPKYIIKLDTMPITRNGKIDLNTLKKYDIVMSETENYTAPENELQQLFCDAWSKLLNTKVGINNNLFELGADSLLAIKFKVEMLSHNIDVQYSDIFKYPTIKELSLFVDNKNTISIPRAEKTEYYPVSSAQKRMYYSSSVDGENSLLYNIAGGIILDKVLDSKKLEKCLQTIINRHESLRTYFEVIDGNIVQKIVEHIDFKLNTETSNSTDIDSLFNDFVKPFNLNKAPLFNAKLITLANNKSLLLLNMHHIISDGTSMSILIDELCNLYNGSNNLSELDIDYKDFAVWENNNINSNEFKKSEEFWVNQFNDEIPLLNMPTNHPRPNVQSFEGNSVYTNINKSLTNKINKLSKELGLTPYMFLLSIYYILLYKYTGQEDVIVGSPITGRDNIQLSNIIGMFVNSLALRSKIDSTLSFKEFSNNIKSMCLQAFEHQTYPFDELVNKLEITRDTSRNPLFDTMFIYQNNGNANVHFDGINSKYYIPNSNISKFDLSLEIIPENDALNLRFEYCTKLFDKEFIEKLSKHYINILNTILENKEIKLANIDMLSEEEKHQILFDFNNTSVPYPKNKTVVQLFEEQAEKNPNNVAVIFEDKKLSYKELNEKANQLAHCLILNNIEENDVVGIMLERSFETIISMFAVLKANASYMLIDPTLPKDRITYMLENANSPLLICSRNVQNIDFNNKLLIDNLDKKVCNIKNLNLDYKIDNPFCVIYTSGSTGVPKGITLKNKGVINLVLSYRTIMNTDICNNFLSISAVSFDMFIVETFVSLLSGKTLILSNTEEQKMPVAISNLINKYNANFLLTTPSRIDLMLENEDTKSCLEHLKILQLGGEVFTTKLFNKLSKYSDINIYNGYGPSEITACCANKKIISTDITIGKPFCNTQIYILNKDNNLCPIGVEGEICVSGDGVSKGYINNPTATNKSFIQNPFGEGLLYKTGDIGKYNSNGELEYIGRKDFQVKLRGLRIELSEIEKHLLNIPNIKNCAVICKGNSYLVAFFTSTQKVDTTYIRTELSKHLPLYMVPKYIIKLDTMPITRNGKIDLNTLKKYEIVVSETENYTAPENELQQLFCDVWSKLLNTKVGINNNIFELGADSLLAIKFKVEMLSHNIDVQYSDIFKYPTIKELSEANKIEISNEIDNYDYTKINTILEKNNIKNYKKIVPNKNNNILLLGSNGFVGMHILYNFIKNDAGKVYCIVRDKNKLSARTRFLDALHFYFDNELDKYLDNRIIILKGDITKENFGLNSNIYDEIVNNVSVLINSSANVRHYGKFKDFENINIGLTKKAIDFCEKYGKRLIQLSTTSVCGSVNTDITFSENNLYVGQNLDNVYIKSKFEAEKLILDHIANHNLNAQILRLGNITSRFSDGKFQINPTENAFISRLQSFIKLGVIPDYLLDMKLEFTPVDLCGNAIINVMQNYIEDFSVLHLFNNNYIFMEELVQYLNKNGFNLKAVNETEFNKIVHNALMEDTKKDMLSGIINELNLDNKINVTANIDILSEFSRIFLNSIDFNWLKIDNIYVEKYINYLKSINFI